jgi:hypothetical protein
MGTGCLPKSYDGFRLVRCSKGRSQFSEIFLPQLSSFSGLQIDVIGFILRFISGGIQIVFRQMLMLMLFLLMGFFIIMLADTGIFQVKRIFDLMFLLVGQKRLFPGLGLLTIFFRVFLDGPFAL